ncbi:glycosyltransferase family 4 protein [Mariniflexile sp.]|uniref:glycosyltransferase family 4 protein n=1 Tax=Mariniflexile sp. TaxID=1979402 RepID=UPI0035646B06
MKNKKVVILFSRLSDYMLNMFETWVKQDNISLSIFKKSPDKNEAPFEFNLNEKNITFYDQDELDKNQIIGLVSSIDPDLIICSGWSNAKYNAVIAKNHKNKTCVLTMDNQWEGSLKQYVGLVYIRLFIVPKFKKIWVPGIPQKKYAIKLGFKKENIILGWYVANENSFKKTREKIVHEFVFVGRYLSFKGVRELWNAFVKLKENVPNDWTLTCIGTGSLFEERKIHPKIKHIGFLQPKELHLYVERGGVFVLPSHFEPWGVVVHEFALSGYPLIVSDKVGAASEFVKIDNGIVFEAKNEDSLYNAMKKMVEFSDHELLNMSKASNLYSETVSSKKWIKNMNNLLVK